MAKRVVAFLSLLLYCFLLIKIMVLKDVPLIRIGPIMLNFGGTQGGTPNFIPFKTILPYLMGENGFMIGALNIIGNIALLVPFGFLLSLVIAKLKWKHVLLFSILSGSLIEITQVLLHVGIFDIDDVILNGLGVWVGYWLYLLFEVMMNAAYGGIVKIVIVLFTLAVFISAIVFIQKNEIGFEPMHEQNGTNHLEPLRTDPTQRLDPCRGTSGTGQIISISKNQITIKKRNGKEEVVVLTDNTAYTNSAGKASVDVLKVGASVTVVIDESNTAVAVMICGL